MIEPVRAVADGPARDKPALKVLPSLRGPSTNPDVGAGGVAAFDEATAAYEAGRDLEAARAFMRAARLFIADAKPPVDVALAKAASVAYDNASWAFVEAARADPAARAEGALALEQARAADAANADQLARLVERLRKL